MLKLYQDIMTNEQSLQRQLNSFGTADISSSNASSNTELLVVRCGCCNEQIILREIFDMWNQKKVRK